MRLAIFSDTHGNIEALEEVLKFLRTQKIDRYVFLGDAVGYGPNPNEVCSALRALPNLVAVLGNHDAAVTGRMPYKEYYEAARKALDWTVSELSSENMAWLSSLPYKHSEDDFTFSHGSPLVPSSFDYIFLPEQLLDVYDEWSSFSHLTFIGHSHLTIAFRFNESEVAPLVLDKIKCLPEFKYVITVGSVGQPRDNDPRACCGIFDTKDSTFTYKRLTYDNEKTRQKIISAGLSSAFGDRLLIGM